MAYMASFFKPCSYTCIYSLTNFHRLGLVGLTWHAGSSSTNYVLVTDSLPFGGDNDGTQLPINPEEYLSTPYVQSMLAREGSSTASLEKPDNVPEAPAEKKDGANRNRSLHVVSHAAYTPVYGAACMGYGTG